MANLNRLQLIGRLVKDPELKDLPSGSLVANLSIATTRRFRDKSGEEQQVPCFVDVVAWNRQAELVEQLLVKGQEVYCEGYLELDQWDSHEECPKCNHQKEVKRQKLRMSLEFFQFLGPLKKDQREESTTVERPVERERGERAPAKRPAPANRNSR